MTKEAKLSELKVHPDADIFPMMSDDELAALAEDIKANGLLHPIMVDKDKQVIDGRNRLAACKIAGVEPTLALTDKDPKALIVSANLNRRNMTKGQQAMALAFIYPEAENTGRGPKSAAKTAAESAGVKDTRLKEARAVLRQSRDLAMTVLSGDMSLDDAFDSIQEQEGELRNQRSRMRKLRETREDLAEKVTNGEIELAVAESQAKKEADERKQRRWALSVNIIDGVQLWDRNPESAAEAAIEFDPSVAESRGVQITPSQLRRIASYATAFADALEKKS